MNIVYQGKEASTDAPTVAAFLESRGVKSAEAVIEYNGDVLTADAARSTPLAEQARLDVFRIVAGG